MPLEGLQSPLKDPINKRPTPLEHYLINPRYEFKKDELIILTNGNQ